MRATISLKGTVALALNRVTPSLGDLQNIRKEQAPAVLQEILYIAERLGIDINWSNLSLLYPESAKAILLALLDKGLAPAVLNGQNTTDFAACLSGGVWATATHVMPHCSCALVSGGMIVSAGHCAMGGLNITHVSPNAVTDVGSGWYGLGRKPLWVGEPAAGDDLALLEIVDEGFPGKLEVPELSSNELFGIANEARVVGYGPSAMDGSGSGSRKYGIVAPIWRDEIRDVNNRRVDFNPAREFVCGAGLSISQKPQDALPFDSGASLYLWDSKAKKWSLAGILSRGAGLSNDLSEGAGGIYMKICAYKAEIGKHVKNVC